jgi:hypothetical protein
MKIVIEIVKMIKMCLKRLKGLQPLVVTGHADTVCSQLIDKMKATYTVLGRLRD